MASDRERTVGEDEIIVSKTDPIYRQLRAAEERHDDRREGQQAGHDMLTGMLADAGVDDDQFVFSL